MLFVASALAVLASSIPAHAVGEFEPISHRQMVERMVNCDFTSVQISYQEELESDVVEIADEAASEDQLRCLINQTRNTDFMVIVAPPVAQQYHNLLAEIAGPEMVADIEAWFADRPELGTPPERQQDEGDDGLARRIEAYCGPQAEGAFTREYGVLTFSPEWLQAQVNGNDLGSETLVCVSYAAWHSKLSFGFIGNEKIAE